MKLLLPLLALALLIAGCAQTPRGIEVVMPSAGEAETTEQEEAPAAGGTLAPEGLCIQACKSAKAEGRMLEQGPCLLNPLPTNPDWVCDVAHSPREEIDNRIGNQCSAFRSGTAGHFIEVNPDCELINKY